MPIDNITASKRNSPNFTPGSIESGSPFDRENTAIAVTKIDAIDPVAIETTVFTRP